MALGAGEHPAGKSIDLAEVGSEAESLCNWRGSDGRDSER